jgi:hypothetical protein
VAQDGFMGHPEPTHNVGICFGRPTQIVRKIRLFMRGDSLLI